MNKICFLSRGETGGDRTSAGSAFCQGKALGGCGCGSVLLYPLCFRRVFAQTSQFRACMVIDYFCEDVDSWKTKPGRREIP